MDIYHKPNDIPKDHCILSVSAFIAENSYKNIENYAQGLDKLQELIKILGDKFYLYVFHDQTIERTGHYNPKINDIVRRLWIPLLERLKKNPRVVLIRYDYPKFRSKRNSFYHVTTFGTMIRFLPLFDGSSKIVMITDIDDVTDESIIESKKTYDKFIQSKADFFFGTALCYYVQSWVRISALEGITDLRIVASSIISKIKLPLSLYENFITGLLDGTAILSKDLLYMKKHAMIKKFRTKHKGFFNELFNYGFDEYFMNSKVLPWLIQHKKKILAKMHIVPTPTLFRKLFINLQIETDAFQNMTDKQKSAMITFLKSILGDKYDDSKDIYDNYNSISPYMKDKDFVIHFYNEFDKLKKRGDDKILHMDELEYRCIEHARKHILTEGNEWVPMEYITIGGKKMNKHIR